MAPCSSLPPPPPWLGLISSSSALLSFSYFGDMNLFILGLGFGHLAFGYCVMDIILMRVAISGTAMSSHDML